MKEQFVTYEIALELKELDFDEPCLGWYDWVGGELLLSNNQYLDLNPTNAPLWQQVIDWFIEKYQLHIYVDFYDTYTFAIKYEKDKYYNRFGSCEMELKTYNEAREQAILKAIELIKQSY